MFADSQCGKQVKRILMRPFLRVIACTGDLMEHGLLSSKIHVSLLQVTSLCISFFLKFERFMNWRSCGR